MNINKLSLWEKILISVNARYFMVGLIIFLFGFILSVASGVHFKPTLFFLFNTTKTTGILTSSEYTNIRVGRTNHIKKYYYSFNLPSGEGINGQSYKASDFKNKVSISEKDSVKIEYSNSHPQISRIIGATHSSSGTIGVIFGLFFVLGLIWILVCLCKGLGRLLLLLNGANSTAILKAITPTNTVILGKKVYSLQYNFVSADGQQIEFTQKSSNIEDISVNSECVVYYSVNNPNKVFAITL